MLVALDFIGSLGGACTVAGRWPGRINKGFRDGVGPFGYFEVERGRYQLVEAHREEAPTPAPISSAA